VADKRYLLVIYDLLTDEFQLTRSELADVLGVSLQDVDETCLCRNPNATGGEEVSEIINTTAP